MLTVNNSVNTSGVAILLQLIAILQQVLTDDININDSNYCK